MIQPAPASAQAIRGLARSHRADSKVTVDDCPQALKDHAFTFSVGVFSLSTDCETISVTVAEELLGPLRSGDGCPKWHVTITMGAQAGVSMGPMAAGVEAGVYVTIGSSGITDAGVTANASTSADVGDIQMTVGQAGYTGSFIDSASTPSLFVQQHGMKCHTMAGLVGVNP